MTTVEVTIDTEDRTTGGSERVVITARGSLAASLRSCILRAGDRFAADPDMQRLVDAVAADTEGS